MMVFWVLTPCRIWFDVSEKCATSIFLGAGIFSSWTLRYERNKRHPTRCKNLKGHHHLEYGITLVLQCI